MSAVTENILFIEVTITLNGEELTGGMTVNKLMWTYPEMRLAVIERVKRKLVETATAGLEPRVTVHEDIGQHPGPWPADSTATEVWIGAR